MIFSQVVILGGVLFVAYANGANDNFKGVATLYGSGTTDYRSALWWATVTTLAGSLAAFSLAAKLISVFQGQGLVPNPLAHSQPFLTAVILGAALTVFLATKLGIPISTTHSLMGALLGGGLAAVGFDVSVGTLLQSFFLPLLVSPLIAVALSLVSYRLLSAAWRFVAVNKQNCVCIANEVMPAAVTPEGYVLSKSSGSLRVIVDQEAQCAQRFTGTVWGINVQRLIDVGHFLSAGAVSFARGLNDTPKIIALGLVAGALNLSWFIGLVAIVMAVGALVSAKKVAEMMSKRITTMDSEQGFLANLVTSFLVIFASKWGFPVSTTHVSCGALFGIGAASGQARWAVIRNILLAWVLTLPFAAVFAGGTFILLGWLS
ncbi:MAG: inorganic phosphate transporter [Deltaproteobacteria bacterium]|nr:inorganic phosphate transporter [Deltaproteobacteria bacterium]